MTPTLSPAKLAEALKLLIPAKLPTLIAGPPGVGKSAIVEDVHKELGIELMILHPVVDDPTDYKGLGFVVDGHAEFLPFGNLRRLMQADHPIGVFIDDLGQASGAVQAAVMQFVLARQINGHKISDHVHFIAATNRKEDRAGVSAMLQPLLSRFTILHLESRTDDWVNWGLSNDMPIELLGFCRFKPSMLESWTPTHGIDNNPTPRNAAEVGKMMKLQPAEELEYPMYAGRLGASYAAELCSYLKIYRQLPSLDSIILSPGTAILPDNPAAKYTISLGLVSRANHQNFDAIMTYMNRMEKEYGVAFAKDISNMKVELTENPSFIRWAIENKNIVI